MLFQGYIMLKVSISKGAKRKMEKTVANVQPPSKSRKVCLLAPSLLLLEIPADTNTSLPVWDALRSDQLDLSWTVNPYSISVHLTPTPPKQAASGSSECASRGTQTSPQSTSVVQPQVLVQPIAQQQGFTHILLRDIPAHNSTQALPSPAEPQKTQLIIGQAASLFVHLPVIIAQTPPDALPSIKTPQAAIQTPSNLQAAPKALVPIQFHTRSSSEIRICDGFLLNTCNAGKRCKMHHTPFPYHWQLRCSAGNQWVDIPLKSQPLLERMYSNVRQEVVCIKDGSEHYKLNFKSMKLVPRSYKYNAVRRLTNSDRPILLNRFSPNCWKIYWWNNFDWEEYGKYISSLLLQMRAKKSECSFCIGTQEYKVDFKTMIQTNVSTGFRREVRCRPVYRSPESMQPYLQTGVQLDHGDPVGDNFNVDPLEEFSSWYPPVWCLTSEQDYSLVEVPARTPAYKKIQNLFYQSLLENIVDIVSIQQIQNRLHWDKYQRHKLHMQKQHTKTAQPLERHLFHGTTKEASEDICYNNFDPRVAGVNGVSCGYGSYFATTAAFSDSYSPKTEPDSIRHMFLAKVLVGKVSRGKAEYRRPPLLGGKTRPYQLFDSCVNNVRKPTMFVVFDSCQCYPYYLIKYRDLPVEICL
ncbi:uncharacterized protein V6R79_008203 [Siganus canaliculatus]